jgi:hypothetical protein
MLLVHARAMRRSFLASCKKGGFGSFVSDWGNRKYGEIRYPIDADPFGAFALRACLGKARNAKREFYFSFF